jgi:uncharacterized protein YeaO (DUF488 family)
MAFIGSGILGMRGPYTVSSVCKKRIGLKFSLPLPFDIPTTPAVVSVKVVRLGTRRVPGEGLRVGTVRRPPRGVPREQIAVRDFYDVWFPVLAPSAETMGAFRLDMSDPAWKRFVRAYRKEMASPEARHALDLLAAFSRRTDLSVGCYCENEARCHRSLLYELLQEHGAKLA